MGKVWKKYEFLETKNVSKSNFYKNKRLFDIEDIDVKKVWVSKKEPYSNKSSFKYFIGYNDNDDIRLLYKASSNYCVC